MALIGAAANTLVEAVNYRMEYRLGITAYQGLQRSKAFGDGAHTLEQTIEDRYELIKGPPGRIRPANTFRAHGKAQAGRKGVVE